jgi:uncharacterized membrane protein YheB (UPF0754 family)
VLKRLYRYIAKRVINGSLQECLREIAMLKDQNRRLYSIQSYHQYITTVEAELKSITKRLEVLEIQVETVMRLLRIDARMRESE